MKSTSLLALASLLLGMPACDGATSGAATQSNRDGGADTGGGDATPEDDAASTDATTPTTWHCEYSTYNFCCVQSGGACGPPTWAGATMCATPAPSDFFYVPCDGFLAIGSSEGAVLYSADSGVVVADFGFFTPAPLCVYGPATVTVSQACLDLWRYGQDGGSHQCEGDGGPLDFCAYLFPDGGS